MDTWLTRTLGIDVPLVQAPMAGVSEGLMAGAVSKAGGLGMIGVMPGRSRADLEEQAAVASSAGRPYGIGLLAWALEKDPAPLEATLESDAALVSVSFGKLRGAAAATQGGREARDHPGRHPRRGSSSRSGRGGLHRRARSRRGRPWARRGRHAGVAPDRARQGGRPGRRRWWDRDRCWPVRRTRCGRGGGLGWDRLPVLPGERVPGGVPRTAAGRGRQRDGVRPRLRRRPTSRLAAGVRRPSLRNRFFDEWVGREDELAADPDALDQYAAARRRRDFDVAVVYAGQGAALLRSETTAAEVVAAFFTER